MEEGEPQDCAISHASVWFVFTPQTLQPIAVDATVADGSSRRLRIGVYKGTSLSALRTHDCYDPAAGHQSRWGHPGQTRFWAYPGTTYYIQVGDEEWWSEGEFDLSLTPFVEPEPDVDYPDPCSDDRFYVGQIRVKAKTEWYLRARSIPSRFTKAEVVGVLKRALKTVSTARNDCGLADNVPIKATYGGTTRKPASLCENRKPDGVMVVAFATYNAEWEGRYCPYWTGGKPQVDSDIQLNPETLTIDPLVNRCHVGSSPARLDLEGTLLHELLHAHGLAHVQDPPSRLTMGVSDLACTSTWRTLGLGDVLALRKRY